MHPQFCYEFTPRLNKDSQGLLLLLDVEIVEESDQDLGYSEVKKFIFQVPSSVVPADKISVKTFYAPLHDVRFHFNNSSGKIDKLKLLRGEYFIAKFFKIWKYKLYGTDKETGSLYSETSSDWDIDLDTLQYYGATIK